MMKIKTLFSIFAIILISFSAKAQEFKPEVGDVGAEVNFSPFSSSPSSIDYMKFRSFFSENQAFRIGILLDFRFDENINSNIYPDGEVTNKTYEIGLRPGFEKHFDGTERLSPYIGVEMELGFKTSESTIKGNGTEWKITGALDENGTERGFVNLGANLIVGADFYFVKNMYLGIEFGYGYEFLDVEKIKIKRDDFPGSSISGGNSYRFGDNFNNALRLGFNF